MAGQGISHTDFAPCRFIFKNQEFNLDKADPIQLATGPVDLG
jgi:hypothetical protein